MQAKACVVVVYVVVDASIELRGGFRNNLTELSDYITSKQRQYNSRFALELAPC